MTTIGERIKMTRKAENMTQQQFSQAICLSQAALSMIERNKANPSKAVIRLISFLFKVNENWLLTGKK